MTVAPRIKSTTVSATNGRSPNSTLESTSSGLPVICSSSEDKILLPIPRATTLMLSLRRDKMALFRLLRSPAEVLPSVNSSSTRAAPLSTDREFCRINDAARSRALPVLVIPKLWDRERARPSTTSALFSKDGETWAYSVEYSAIAMLVLPKLTFSSGVKPSKNAFIIEN